jgi:hypothetical protein
MRFRNRAVLFFLLVAAGTARAADTPYAVRTAAAAPPAEVDGSIRKLLGDKAVQLVNAKGDLLAELWFRKEVPAKATEGQIKNGLTYQELPETTLVGVLRVARATTDYRKQKVKPGVYTLRLAIQPQDGDHMGTAPYSEFLLASPAGEDKKPDLMDAKDLQEMSTKVTNSHPSVWLLFPGKGAGAEPKLVSKGMGHWVLLYTLDVKAGDKKATLPLGLTLIGTSSAA